jgi:hypothetical protein
MCPESGPESGPSLVLRAHCVDLDLRGPHRPHMDHIILVQEKCNGIMDLGVLGQNTQKVYKLARNGLKWLFGLYLLQHENNIQVCGPTISTWLFSD